jgi:hypothetical protein
MNGHRNWYSILSALQSSAFNACKAALKMAAWMSAIGSTRLPCRSEAFSQSAARLFAAANAFPVEEDVWWVIKFRQSFGFTPHGSKAAANTGVPGGFEKFGRKGRRELYLDQMEQVTPWPESILAWLRPPSRP